MKTAESQELLYRVEKSGIHNHGLFSAKYIPKGSKIIEYVGNKLTKKESQRRAEAWDEEARTTGEGLVYIFELNKRFDIDGNIESNTARLINHSCEPNCEAEISRGRIWILSTRDIEEGEELSYDYGYDMEHFLDHPCRCGKPSCIGYIVSKDQRSKVLRLLKKRRPDHLKK